MSGVHKCLTKRYSRAVVEIAVEIAVVVVVVVVVIAQNQSQPNHPAASSTTLPESRIPAKSRDDNLGTLLSHLLPTHEANELL